MSDKEQPNKRGRNWKAKYLTIESFNEWKGQDFFHLCIDVKVIKWGLTFLTALVITILIKLFLG